MLPSASEVTPATWAPGAVMVASICEGLISILLMVLSSLFVQMCSPSVDARRPVADIHGGDHCELRGRWRSPQWMRFLAGVVGCGDGEVVVGAAGHVGDGAAGGGGGAGVGAGVGRHGVGGVADPPVNGVVPEMVAWELLVVTAMLVGALGTPFGGQSRSGRWFAGPIVVGGCDGDGVGGGGRVR